MVASLSPSRFTTVARQRGACLTDARLLSGEGWGDRTPGRTCLRRRGVAVVKKVALPSGGANAHDVFAAGGSSICGARRGSRAQAAAKRKRPAQQRVPLVPSAANGAKRRRCTACGAEGHTAAARRCPEHPLYEGNRS